MPVGRILANRAIKITRGGVHVCHRGNKNANRILESALRAASLADLDKYTLGVLEDVVHPKFKDRDRRYRMPCGSAWGEYRVRISPLRPRRRGGAHPPVFAENIDGAESAELEEIPPMMGAVEAIRAIHPQQARYHLGKYGVSYSSTGSMRLIAYTHSRARMDASISNPLFESIGKTRSHVSTDRDIDLFIWITVRLISKN